MSEATSALATHDIRVSAFRRRILQALTEAITENGLAATTMNDIVARAALSKRDFYLAYSTKEEAFLDLYRAASRQGIAVLRASMQEPGPTAEVVRRGVEAFLSLLDEQPALARAHFLDIYQLGLPGLRVRREVLDDYAEAIWTSLERARGRKRSRRMPIVAITGCLGAINELALAVIEREDGTALAGLTDEVLEGLAPVLALDDPAPHRTR